MRSWFESLAERERILVLTAAVVIVLATFWFGIWTPLDSGQESAAARVDTWRISLAELRPLKSQIQASGSGQPVQAAQNQPLVVAIGSVVDHRELSGFGRDAHAASEDPITWTVPAGVLSVSFATRLNREGGLLVR